uniref:Scavenger receptor class F member 2 n=1 Tax=Magallana gigas TaxID=29159 RepID=A0A8W8M4M2_MAGGI
MMSLSGQSVYLLDVLIVWFCLLAVSQAYVNFALNKPAYHLYPALVIGVDTYDANRLQGTLCYKDDNFTRDTVPAVFTTTCPVHGQYVIYYNERLQGVTYPDDYYVFVNIALCEVEVYGCPRGFYGTNCSNACPDTNCYCHIETGTCQGCKPGFQGYLCKLACDSGWMDWSLLSKRLPVWIVRTRLYWCM